MKIALSAMFGTSPYRGMPFVRDYAVLAEELGFSSLWAPEHIVFFGDYDAAYPYTKDGKPPWKPGKVPEIFDPLFVIAAAAGVTTTLRFGTTVLIVPERPPLLTAKEVMTLDHLTDGRFDFGVGLGWSAEEYRAMGVTWEKRGKRFDEYLDVIKLAWTEERVSYHGEFIDIENAILKPLPLTPGGPPILIGGNSQAAIRRAVRIGDGWYGVWRGFDDLEEKIAEIRRCLGDAGRSVEDGFQVKLNFPMEPGVAPEDIKSRAREAARCGISEFVLELPIRSRHMDADMRFWADLLEVA
jgi:probable F420-dependent oxidoreductase